MTKKKQTKLETAAGAVKVLKKARKLVAQPDGWIKGALDTGYRVCAIGAVVRTATGKPATSFMENASGPAKQALTALTKAINPSYPTYEPYIVYSFNDNTHRTQEEVVAKFDKAIKDQCAVVRKLAKAQEKRHAQRTR